MSDLKGKRVAIVVTDGFEQVEMTSPREGRHMTSWPTLQDDMRNAGAQWEDKECVRDRNWVSSRKPDDLPAFNREMVALFSTEEKKSGKVDAVEVRA